MATTLHQENLDVGASEKTIQFLLGFSASTTQVTLPTGVEALQELFKN